MKDATVLEMAISLVSTQHKTLTVLIEMVKTMASEDKQEALLATLQVAVDALRPALKSIDAALKEAKADHDV
jgi:cell division protein FtsL